MTRKATVEVHVTYEIEVEDDVVVRCVENHDDEGNPQPIGRARGTFTLDERGWQDVYYDLDTPERVFEHLAFNLGLNNRRLSVLDGWADLPDDAAKCRGIDADFIALVEGPA